MTQKDGALTALRLGLLLLFFHQPLSHKGRDQMRGSHWDSTQGAFRVKSRIETGFSPQVCPSVCKALQENHSSALLGGYLGGLSGRIHVPVGLVASGR